MRKIRRYNNYMAEIINDVNRKDRKETLQREKEQNGIQQDFNNREYIRNKIKEHMIYGISKEDAVDLVMQEEKDRISQDFDYLTKNGIDIRQCLINWSVDIEKQLEDKSHSNNKEER